LANFKSEDIFTAEMVVILSRGSLIDLRNISETAC
jgi:hypothetical protein